MQCRYGYKVFDSSDIKTLDKLSLQMEGISEEALIARAAKAFFEAISVMYPVPRQVFIFCGPGNNGKDGRALAPLLQGVGYKVKVFDLPESNDVHAQLPNHNLVPDSFPVTPSTCQSVNLPLIIDALFGAGLNRPLTGTAKEWVEQMNAAAGIRIALDIPSGWHGKENKGGDASIFRAHHTITLEFPKLSFFFPESAPYVGEWRIVPIGLHSKALAKCASPYYFTQPEDLCMLLPPLPRFLHKGRAGRARLYAGSAGMSGAAVLALKAAYRIGAGWVQALAPVSEVNFIQLAVPEALVHSIDTNENTALALKADGAAFAAGPGLGTSEEVQTCLRRLLKQQKKAVILDADALNILAQKPEIWTGVPKNSILTPHPKEFERLAGTWQNDYRRLQLQRQFAAQHHVIVVLKGAFTSIAFPDGTVRFNPSGNPGMATAGSGDVLTGILLGLLAQGLPPQETAVLGVYLHGLAGDLAAEELGQRSVMASDILHSLPVALRLMVPEGVQGG